jgi:hypothetical protein
LIASRLLVVGEFGLAPHLHALGLGAFAAFAGAGADQFAFELGKGSAAQRPALAAGRDLRSH